MWSSRLPGCRKMYCSIFHSFFHSFFKTSRGAGSQFSFFSSFFSSFLMVYVYKNEQKMDQKWELWAPLFVIPSYLLQLSFLTLFSIDLVIRVSIMRMNRSCTHSCFWQLFDTPSAMIQCCFAKLNDMILPACIASTLQTCCAPDQ